MLGLQWACIVSALLPKTQYLREQIYQALFSLMVHHYYKVAILVCGDIVSPTILSSRCWYRFAKSAMDFFGCCMPTKNSLTVQDSVIWLMLFFCSKSIILFLQGSAGAVKIRWVLRDWTQKEHATELASTCNHTSLWFAIILWVNAESRGGYEGFGEDP